MRASPLPRPCENRMTPSAFQLPPKPPLTGVSVSGAPPPTSSRLRASIVKNPIDRLSGDQNGNEAPSVPGRGCAVVAAKARSNRRDTPLLVSTNTICLPSGDNAMEPSKRACASVCGGALISVRVSAGGVSRRYFSAGMASAAATRIAMPNAIFHPKDRPAFTFTPGDDSSCGAFGSSIIRSADTSRVASL